MDLITMVEREVLESLKEEARKQYLIIERCNTVIRTINIEINKPSETPAMDRWYKLLERVTRAKENAEALYIELRIKIQRILNSGGTGGGGTGGGTLPTPPKGVVDLKQLTDVVKIVPTNKVYSSWGTGVVYPEMRDSLYKIPNPQGTHAIISQAGTGPNGILAQKTPPLLFKNNWLEGTGLSGYGPHTRWNCRAFGATDWTIDGSYIFNNPDEHGFYINSIWSMTFKNSLFENIGSQAIQVVWRDHEAVNFDDFKDPYGNGTRAQFIVDSCAFIEVGQPTGGRPSFGISGFELQPWEGIKECDVIIQGSYFDSHLYANYEKDGGPYYSYGAVMVHGHRDVYLIKNVFRYRKPNREIFQLWNCENIVIEECEVGDPYDNSQVVIDIRNPRGTVTIKGCTGNATVMIAKNAPLYKWPIDYDYVGKITEDVVV